MHCCLGPLALTDQGHILISMLDYVDVHIKTNLSMFQNSKLGKLKFEPNVELILDILKS